MPSETRRLTFTAQEARAALAVFHRAIGGCLPPGAIMSVRLEEEPDPIVVFALDDRAGGQRHELVMPMTRVAAALIHYCRAQKIPLPRQSTKSLALADGCLALDIRVGSVSRAAAA